MESIFSAPRPKGFVKRSTPWIANTSSDGMRKKNHFYSLTNVPEGSKLYDLTSRDFQIFLTFEKLCTRRSCQVAISPSPVHTFINTLGIYNTPEKCTIYLCAVYPVCTVVIFKVVWRVCPLFLPFQQRTIFLSLSHSSSVGRDEIFSSSLKVSFAHGHGKYVHEKNLYIELRISCMNIKSVCIWDIFEN